MKLTIILCLALTACDTGAMNRMYECRREAGREPMAGAGLFGPIGLMMAHQDPVRAAWDDRINQCMKEARR